MQAGEHGEAKHELDLRAILRVLRHRKWIIVATTVVAVGAALGVSLTQSKIYSASADVLISNPDRQVVFDGQQQSGYDAQRLLDTQIEIVKSTPVADRANDALGKQASQVTKLTASGVGETDLLRISARSTSPQTARAAATIYADVFVNTRREQAVEASLAAGDELLTQITETQGRLDQFDQEIAALGAQEGTQAQIDGLDVQRSAAATQYALFTEKYEQLQVEAQLQQGGAQLVAEASLPAGPVEPRPLRSGVLAGMLGLLLGIGLAFLVESLDDSIKTSDDLERHVHGIPFLGDLPRFDKKRTGDRTLVALEQPDSVPAEAFRSLRTSLQVVQLRQPLDTLLITSCTSGEGKSTVAANLAVTLARANKKVALLDLDLRRPTIAQFFRLPLDQGFSSVLLGDRSVDDAMFTVPVQPGTPPRVLPAGTVPANPSELLGTKWFADLLAHVSAQVDIVLIDSPPLLQVTDSMVLASQVDGVMLVARGGTTRRRQLARASEMLHRAGAPIVGAVLNGVKGSDGYGYGYGYGYGPPAEDKDSRVQNKPTQHDRFSRI